MEPVTMTLPAPSAATAAACSPSDPAPPKRFDQRCAPLGAYLATNMSPPPRSGSRPPPKSTAPVKLPVTITLPLPSSATLVAPSSLVPPKLLDHRGAPSGEYSARKMSRPPALVSSPVPKSAVFWKSPVTATFPPPSTAMPCATSKPLPPNRLAHRGPPSAVAHSGTPAAEYSATNTSLKPELVIGPVPKSTVPSNEPATATLPLGSVATAIACAASNTPEPPICRFQMNWPPATHAGVLVLAATLMPDVLPALSTAATL